MTTGKQQPHFDRVQAVIRELGMRDEVIFTDYVGLDTLYALYEMASAVVLPTLFEGGTGIPLLEAMAKGKPVAAARVCEIPETLAEAGLLFDPYSESEISSTIERLWESADLRSRLAEKARRSNSGRSWARFAEATEAAFLHAYNHPNCNK